MSRKKYSKEELLEFLKVVDSYLEESAEIIVIGGTAVILAHGVTTTTEDIDTFNSFSPALNSAIEKACEQTGQQRGFFNHSAVADLPDGYEERLLLQNVGGQHLQVFVLEKHDLVLSKVMRWDQRDQQHVADIHKNDPLDFSTLVQRFRDELRPICVGDTKRITGYFLWMISDVFGELKSVRAARLLGNG